MSEPQSGRAATEARGGASRRLFWLFGTGDLTTSAPLAIIAFFQLFFLTDVARLSPAYAGLAILLGKLWDAVNDPVVGVLADRVRSRFGRRRVLLLAGAAPVGLSFLLMWMVPPLSTPLLIAYYTATYILFDTCFTVVGVAYNSLTPTLTSDYDEQSSLNGIRMVYSISGSLLAVIVGTVLQWVIDDEGRLFVLLGVIVGAVIAIPPLVVARAVKERDTVSGGAQPPTLRGLRQVLENRPFRAAMGVYLTSWTAVTLIAANLVYYARYNLGIPDQANYFVLVAQSVALLFIPVSVAIARRWDKRTAAFLGFGTMVPVLVAIAMVSPERYQMVYGLAALLGLGIATAYVTPWSMIPDVIQWDARETGTRREGTYYAVVSFVQKLGTALALWAVAQALGASGYVTPTEAVPLPVQPAATLGWIRAFLTIVPAGLLLASMAFASIYPITRSVHADITAELEERGI